jgi:hypothetical protein
VLWYQFNMALFLTAIARGASQSYHCAIFSSQAADEEMVMKKIGVKLLLVAVFIGLAGCASMSNQLAGAEGKPDVFCRILKEPDPLLMGSWKVTYESTLDTGGAASNTAEYRLIKVEDKYALYFYRVSLDRKKRYMGWREWTINGTDISSVTGVRIFTRDGQVFLEWQGEQPTKMYRTGG